MLPSASELRSQFLALESFDDIADLLAVSPKYLKHCFYSTTSALRYCQFNVARKSGEPRLIAAPIRPIKEIQKNLCHVLQEVYKPKPSVHGFTRARSIVSNANLHVRRNYVLNIDLNDFFPSIHFGRVRGMFMATPYSLNASVATILAQICCYNKQLPQGAPTSPVVSNMICGRMDSDLQRLAKLHKCYYSRYADDITFSTRLRVFPRGLATLNSLGQLEVGSELKHLIVSNGFQINERKLRLQNVTQRQEVTGLTVNEKANVRSGFKRQIRGMLYAWDKHGLDAAQREFFDRYDFKSRNVTGNAELFKQVLKGKIVFVGMVRGKTDLLYLRYCLRLIRLDPELMTLPVEDQPNVDDPFSPLESGLKIMLFQLDKNHPRHRDGLNLEHRLKENIRSARQYGDNESNRSDRNRIVEQLNKLCLDAFLKNSFNELCNI